VTVVAVAAISFYTLVGGHAQSPYAATEAEQGNLTGSATVVGDSTASGSSAIKFGSGGIVNNVPVSIASDCSVDVTSALLSWIASVPDNSTLLFGTNKCYRVESTVEIRSRNGLMFEGNGSTFKSLNPMTTGSTIDDQRAMWRVIGSTNFIFRNMTIIGAYANGGTHDPTLQHAHGIDIRGTSAEIANVNMSNLAGDCVYFGLGYDNITRSSGSYHDSTCSSIGRNAASITAANNVTVNKITTNKVGYTAFDLEPNVGTYTNTTGWGTSNISVMGSTVGSYYLYAFSVVENAPNLNDSFTGNTITSSNGLRVGVVAPGSAVRPNNITVSNNSASIATWSPAIEAHNVDILTVTNNTVPMIAGSANTVYMATVDNSCKANVSGNSYPGGAQEVLVTNPVTSC